jgi:hypothetical protein
MIEQHQTERKDLKFRLPLIKSLAMLKMEKNFIAHCEKKYPRQPYKELPTSYIIQRIEEELAELKEGFEKLDIQNMMEECADISNLTDYLFENLLSFQVSFNKPKETNQEKQP